MNEKELQENVLNAISINNFSKKSIDIILNSIDEKYGLNIDHVLENTFSIKNKSLRKKFKILLSNKKPDLNVLRIFKILAIDLKINIDLIVSAYDFESNKIQFPNQLTGSLIKELHKMYTDKRVVDLVLKTSNPHFKDISYMLKKIKANNFQSYLPRKVKSYNELHFILQKLIQKIDIKDFNLEQREDILKLDNKTISDDMKIIVPKTHYDLVRLGEALNFCIGNGGYSESVFNGYTSIIAVYKNNKPLYGIQFTRYSLLASYGFDNEVIPSNILVKIQNELIKAPSIPSDFLIVTDSSWIKGYKYDNENLYLIMGKKIYLYRNIPSYLYEELVNTYSKGAFINNEIKGCFKSEYIGELGFEDEDEDDRDIETLEEMIASSFVS